MRVDEDHFEVLPLHAPPQHLPAIRVEKERERERKRKSERERGRGYGRKGPPSHPDVKPRWNN